MYLLPPALFPADPLDTTDQRYLNYEHVPLQHPLQKALKIDLYNTKYLQPPLAQLQGSQQNQLSQPIDTEALVLLHIPTTNKLHQETNTSPEPYESIDDTDEAENTNRLTTIQQSSEDEIDLHTNINILLGSFNFEPLSSAKRTRYKVHHDQWDQYYQQCIAQNITPPSIGSQVHQQQLPHRRRKQLRHKSNNLELYKIFNSVCLLLSINTRHMNHSCRASGVCLLVDEKKTHSLL